MNYSTRLGRTILLAMSATLLPLQLSTAQAGENPHPVRGVQIIGSDLTDDELEQYLREALAGRALTVYVPPPPPDLPDLVINKINVHSFGGNTLSIEAEVENQGTKDSPAYDIEVFVQLYQNGAIVAALSWTRERFDALDAGDTRLDRFSATVQLKSLPLGANVLVEANVDPDLSTGGRIRETH